MLEGVKLILNTVFFDPGLNIEIYSLNKLTKVPAIYTYQRVFWFNGEHFSFLFEAQALRNMSCSIVNAP